MVIRSFVVLEFTLHAIPGDASGRFASPRARRQCACTMPCHEPGALRCHVKCGGTGGTAAGGCDRDLPGLGSCRNAKCHLQV
jgi:hypothetical protein